ncbi:MAG: ABC transporter substrate-binding protein [Propionibacteriaceae bacterium]|jgi:hypothetical protein|nr:ABC transporter substrate-binding protein [Propionibacteriaceae bacterium]
MTGRIRLLACLTSLVTAVGLNGCTEQPAPPPDPLPAVSVSLTLTGPVAKQPIRVGVLVGPTSGPGSEYRDGAGGARVASYRFGMGGADVQIAVAVDDGTVDGATRALTQLANDNVIGIVAAADGPHLTEALATTPIKPPVLLPYTISEATIPAVWSTGATPPMLRQAADQALGDLSMTKPYLVTQVDHADLGIVAAASETLSSESAQHVVASLDEGRVDSLIIDASASNQAALVLAVQKLLGARQIPIVLTPAALTSTFGDALTEAGSPLAVLVALGPNTGDPASLATDTGSSSVSAFFSALRLAADDPTCLNIFSDDTFAADAQTADIPSHDAVIALVRAAEQAGSVSPERVQQALRQLDLDSDDGLAGPRLDFFKSDALEAGSVEPLYASTHNPGLRPDTADSTSQGLYWFSAN